MRTLCGPCCHNARPRRLRVAGIRNANGKTATAAQASARPEDSAAQLLPAYAYELQGAHEGSLFLTADDGDADLGEPDHVYRVTVEQDATHATVALERTLDDVTLQGEIEGLTFTDDGQMLVLYNRGARIVASMPVGFL